MTLINQRAHVRNSVTRNLNCANCGRAMWPRSGRRPRFCSDRCRERGRKRVRKRFLGRDTGAPTKHQKTSSIFKTLRRAKIQSSHPIFGPADVLALEMFDRPWKSATSSGGVAVEIGRLRARVLMS
jgi:hypothetical protein